MIFLCIVPVRGIEDLNLGFPTIQSNPSRNLRLLLILYPDGRLVLRTPVARGRLRIKLAHDLLVGDHTGIKSEFQGFSMTVATAH